MYPLQWLKMMFTERKYGISLVQGVKLANFACLLAKVNTRT